MSTTTASSNENSLPLHTPSTTATTSSSNYASALSAKTEQDGLDNAPVKVNDGRKNSVGEELPSPVTTWKPNLARQQSWNQQDQKRSLVLTELENAKADGKGFSEVGKA